MRKDFKVFAVVGAMGFVVQVGVIASLTTMAHWQYWTATIAAVEVAILHNFWWHEQWTWRRRRPLHGEVLTRLLRFHAGAGCISIAGNVLFTTLGVQSLHVGVVTANIGAVALTSLANFWVANRWIFHGTQKRPT
jgi:putative flippase GtrA